MAKILDINKNIGLEVKEGVYKGNFKSRIEDMKPGKIIISAPSKKGEYVPLRVGTQVTVLVYEEVAICAFDCHITARKKGNIPLLVLALPKTFRRIQRRDFYRLKIKLPLFYRSFFEEEGDSDTNEEEEFRTGEMVDISGGGLLMQLLQEEDFSKNSLLELKVEFPDLGEQLFKGKVAARFTRNEKEFMGVEFVQIETKLQDDIVGWIFDKLREMRKKGIL